MISIIKHKSYILLLFLLIISCKSYEIPRHDENLKTFFENTEIDNLNYIVSRFENQLQKELHSNINSNDFYNNFINNDNNSIIDSKKLRNNIIIFCYALNEDSNLIWEIKNISITSYHTYERKKYREFSFNIDSKYIHFLENFSKTNKHVENYFHFIKKNNRFPSSPLLIKNIVANKEINRYSALDFKSRLLIAIHYLSQNLD